MFLRDGSHSQIGLIFGKLPNGLRPPPPTPLIFGKSYCIFSENVRKKPSKGPKCAIEIFGLKMTPSPHHTFIDLFAIDWAFISDWLKYEMIFVLDDIRCCWKENVCVFVLYLFTASIYWWSGPIANIKGQVGHNFNSRNLKWDTKNQRTYKILQILNVMNQEA